MESVVFGEVIQQEQELQKHKPLACSTVPSLFPPVFLLASLPQHSLFSADWRKGQRIAETFQDGVKGRVVEGARGRGCGSKDPIRRQTDDSTTHLMAVGRGPMERHHPPTDDTVLAHILHC
ncbi:unnamed protein product [Arctogadus glacialis]